MWHRVPKKHEDPIRKNAAYRMRRLSESEILDWADQAGTGVAVALQDYRKGADEALEEARKALSALQGVLDALESRQRH